MVDEPDDIIDGGPPIGGPGPVPPEGAYFGDGTAAEPPTDEEPEFEQLDEGGLSPLQRAVLSGDIHRVDELLSRGADPDRVVVSADGRLGTALMSAITLRDPATRLAVVSMLLKAGANPNRLMDGGSNPPLRFLLENAEPGSDDSLGEVVRALTDHGARMDHSLMELAQEHSLFGIEYEFKRRHASDTPIEEPTRMGCCLLPLAVIGTLVAVILFVVSQYVDLAELMGF